tara:strand:- start:2611 stop:2751 length:141 start_codon:yes stop_codon:yes gene_type:complete
MLPYGNDDKSLEGTAVLGALSTYIGNAVTARFSDLHFIPLQIDAMR